MTSRSRSGAAAGHLHSPANRKFLAGIAVFLLLLLALAAAWRWTPMREWLDVDSLVAAADYLNEGAYTPLVVAATYLVAGLVMFPVTVLNLVIIIVFGPWLGPLYAICGASLSAASTYWLGRRLGRKRVQRLAGARINRLSKQLAKRGVVAMSLVRLVPIGPFTVVNVVAGASQIGFRDFMLGTVIGLAPGLTASALFVSRAKAVFTDPSAGTIALLVAVIVAIGVAVFFLRRRFVERD